MASILPNGRTSFDDASGRPLVGGSVYYYEVGTETPKDTFQNQAASIPNTNPVVLDARGEATIWGNGSYRQVVKDKNGVLVWDQVIAEQTESTQGEIDDFKSTLAGQTGASLIGFLQSGSGATARTVQDKERETALSITDFGADQTFADNSGQVQNAVNAAGLNRDVIVPFGAYKITTKPSNRYGARLLGQGKLLVPDQYGGVEQFNTYRGTRPIAQGKEYFWPVYSVLQNTNQPVRIYTYGDSTVAGGFNYIDWPFFLQQFIPDACSARGVRNAVQVTNRGVGGSNLSTWNPGPDIGTNSSAPAHLVILKSGINDATFPLASRLDTFRDNLRAGLQTIRSIANGDPTSTAILLVGPNPTIDKQIHARNAEWYEQIRGIYEAAARDFKCAYFDAYEYLQDVEWASGTWINNDTASGESPVSLHPRNVGQSWIWGAIVDFIFGDSEIFRYKTNNFHNRSVYFGFPSAKNPPTWFPSNYDAGITLEVAAVADGFPFAGILETMKSSEAPVRQKLWSLDATGLCASRTTNANSGIWGDWKGIGTNISLVSGWTNFGAPYQVARYMARDDGSVTLSGLIRPGATAAGTLLFTLPLSAAPANQQIVLTTMDSGAVAALEIFANGNVTLRSGVPATFLSLNNVTFLQN